MKNNKKWKSKSETTPLDVKDCYQELLNIRNLNQDWFNNSTSLKDLLKTPQDLGIDKENLTKALKILKDLKKSKKGIVIHGDYDVDGITSTQILRKLFINLGVSKEQIECFIPNRFDHGYGFSNESLEHISNNLNVKEYPLIVLVDCGIKSVEQVKRAKKLGYRIIIIDHHGKGKKLPKSDALFWTDKLTAAAISYFFKKYIEISINKNTKLKDTLDLATLGYICDLGNLNSKVGYTLTKEGIDYLRTGENIGINSILKINDTESKNISSYHVGWVIGPRINAAGRLEDGVKSLNLLNESDESTALSIAQDLEDTNKERQNKTKEMLDEAITGISNGTYTGKEQEEKACIIDSKNFNEGIIGLVSARVVQILNKPTFTVSWDENGDGKGSSRSIENFNVTKALEYCKEFLEGYGGHEMAAGFSLKKKNFNKFKTCLLEYCGKNLSQEDLVPTIKYDFLVSEDFLQSELMELIETLEPFGNKNPKPVFLIKNVVPKDIKTMGKDNTHIKFLTSGGKECVYFNGAKYEEHLNQSENGFDILFNFDKNVWNDRVYLKLMVKEIRPSEF